MAKCNTIVYKKEQIKEIIAKDNKKEGGRAIMRSRQKKKIRIKKRKRRKERKEEKKRKKKQIKRKTKTSHRI